MYHETAGFKKPASYDIWHSLHGSKARRAKIHIYCVSWFHYIYLGWEINLEYILDIQRFLHGTANRHDLTVKTMRTK